MNASDDPINYDALIQDLNSSIEQVQKDVRIVDGLLNTLCQDIFATPASSFDRLIRAADRRGIDAVMRQLRDHNLLRGREQIGFLRGGLLRPAARREALSRIEQLEPVLLERRKLRDQIRALETTRRRARDEQDRARLPQPKRGLGRLSPRRRSPDDK